MKKKFAAMASILLFAGSSFGQASPEKYVGQYQVTGAPIMITVTASGAKLAIEATGQGKAGIQLMSGEKVHNIIEGQKATATTPQAVSNDPSTRLS